MGWDGDFASLDSCRAILILLIEVESDYMVLHTMFFAGGNLGRPSSSTCISMSLSVLSGTFVVVFESAISGASNRSSSSSI